MRLLMAAGLVLGRYPSGVMPTLLIKNGRVIDPASGLDAVCDVAVEVGRIVEIGPKLTTAPATEVIDAEGLIVAPGLVDPHVHLRQPGQSERETIQTGAAAAVAGGFTTVVCMPNTTPAIDTPEIVQWVRSESASALCRVFPIGAVSVGRKGEALTEIMSLAQAGAVGFSDDGDVIASAGLMFRALRAVVPTGLAIMQHCQEPTLTKGASMNASALATRLGLVGWPAIAEETIIERDLRLNKNIGCRYHVQHISSADSVEIIRQARCDATSCEIITAEASPHHLILTEQACDGFDTRAKMNPPLRTDADRHAIRQGVAEGVITVLATDHAPHTAESKATDFESASFGLIGLETALPLYAEALVHTGALDWPRLIALLTINPAKLCNLDSHGLGALAVGGTADITLIDPDLDWTFRAEESKSQGRNTPFDGRQLRGKAVATIVAGEIRNRIVARVSALQ